MRLFLLNNADFAPLFLAPPLFFLLSYIWSFTPFVRTSSAQTLEKSSGVEAKVLPFKMAAAASRASPQDVNRCGRRGRVMFSVKVGELPPDGF